MTKYQKLAFEPIVDGNIHYTNTRKKQVLNEADLQAARDQGFQEGEQSAIAQASKQSADAMRSIARMMQLLLGKLHNEVDDLRHDALDVAMTAAEAIAEEALKKCGEENIKNYIKEAVSNLPDSAKIIVKVSPDLVDLLTNQISQVAKDAGFDGKLDLRGDENSANFDCAIEWQGGAIRHNKQATLEAIRTAAAEWLKTAEAEEMQLDLFEP